MSLCSPWYVHIYGGDFLTESQLYCSVHGITCTYVHLYVDRCDGIKSDLGHILNHVWDGGGGGGEG